MLLRSLRGLLLVAFCTSCVGVVASDREDTKLDGDNDDVGTDLDDIDEDPKLTDQDNGGDPGPIPHVVGDCNNLGEVGEWQNITPNDAPGLSMSPGLLIDPNVSGTVYAATFVVESYRFIGRGVYKSVDCGSTWESKEAGDPTGRLNDQAAMLGVIDPVDSQNLYAVGYGTTIFKSSDGGETWFSIGGNLPTEWVQWIAMNPNDPDHLLVTFHNVCSAPLRNNCMADSHDGGQTWRAFSGPEDLDGWMEGAGPYIVSDDIYLYGVPLEGLYRSNDAGAHWDKILEGSGCGSVVVKGSDGNHYIACWDGVYRSTDPDVATWTKIGGPHTDALIEIDGYWYASMTNDYSNSPYRTAPVDTLTPWTTLTTPPISQGASAFRYDPDHHLLYASSMSGGLWRVRLQ